MKSDFNFAATSLNAGEQILWQGAPGLGNLLTRGDIFMIPFSVLWCAICCFTLALAPGGSWKLQLFLSVFALIGIYILVGRFIIIAIHRRKTLYVITNQRILLKQGHRVRQLSIANMPPMHTQLLKNGFGTIWFRSYRSSPSGYTLQPFSRRSAYGEDEYWLILENIPEVVKIYKLLSALKK